MSKTFKVDLSKRQVTKLYSGTVYVLDKFTINTKYGGFNIKAHHSEVTRATPHPAGGYSDFASSSGSFQVKGLSADVVDVIGDLSTVPHE